MSVGSLGEKIKSRLERKMARVAERLSELEDDGELLSEQGRVAAQVAEVETEIAALQTSAVEARPGVRERLEAKRERLWAHQERLELKIELGHDRRDRLQESLDDMRLRIQESVSELGAGARRQPRSSQGQAPTRRMQDEQRKILEMVQQGTINADEAARLLDALRTQEASASRARRRPRWVRIRVTDLEDNKVRVNLTLPVGLVRAGLRAGGSIAGVAGLDTAGLEEMLDRGEIGHLLDLSDAADGERIEVFVE
ncbi:MAG: hypothetical protein MUQ30_05815 [Anaerolineae bacterium]|nr:hypothetical protein [Anaerolineae bacterium]